MKGIILAAGRGSRLGDHTADKPKSLLKLGNKSLMRRSMENLQASGFDEVVIVLGYKHEMLEEELQKYFPSDFYKVIINEDYTRGSGSSLICAKEEFEGDIVIVESDLLYDKNILVRMSSNKIQNAFSMGYFNHGRKEVKLYLQKDGTIEKAAWAEASDTTADGDWVGFTRLCDESSRMLRENLRNTNPDQGKEYNYEFFLFELLNHFPFQSIYIQDLPWIEIDNDIDLRRAQTEIYPKIDGLIPVAV